MEKDNKDALNIKQFVQLVKRYESLSIEEVKKVWEKTDIQMGHQVAQKLTGFGGSLTCTLCIAVNKNCELCVYGYQVKTNLYGYHAAINFCCIGRPHRKTYNDIDNAKSPRQLLGAYRRRAKHMRNRYPQYFK